MLRWCCSKYVALRKLFIVEMSTVPQPRSAPCGFGNFLPRASRAAWLLKILSRASAAYCVDVHLKWWIFAKHRNFSEVFVLDHSSCFEKKLPLYVSSPLTTNAKFKVNEIGYTHRDLAMPTSFVIVGGTYSESHNQCSIATGMAHT